MAKEPPVRIVLGNINPGMITSEFAQSAIRSAHLFSAVILRPRVTFIDLGRNDVVQLFLQSKDTHLLFCDSDMVFMPEHVERLAQVASQNRNAIVSGWANTIPHTGVLTPNVFRIDFAGQRIPVNIDELDGKTEPFEVDSVGAAFCLIPRHILLRVLAQHPLPLSPYSVTVEGNNFIGEDHTFCRRVIDAGFKVLVVPDVKVGHIKAINL